MIDRILYQQQKRAKQLAEMRASFIVREAVEREIKAERSARMAVLAEQAEARRAIERAERRRQEQLNLRDPEHPLYHIAVANNLGGREFTEKEIAALHPCGRFDQLKRNQLGSIFNLDVKRAVALGATLDDLIWVARQLTRVNPEAERRYTLWHDECKSRGQGYKFRRFIAIFSTEDID